MTLTGKHTPARRMAARQLVLSRELRRERKHLTQWAPGQYRDSSRTDVGATFRLYDYAPPSKSLAGDPGF